jgi:hypothetical protein
LSEVLKLPEPNAPKRKQKPGFNTGKSVSITNDSFLINLINEDGEKIAKEESERIGEREKNSKKKPEN